MFDISVITKSLVSILSDSLPNVVSERSVVVNVDPERMPWIGIYIKNSSVDPKILGCSNCKRWKGTLTLSAILQVNSLLDEGTQASDELEELISDFETVINNHIDLGVLRTRVVRFNREYNFVLTGEDLSGNLFRPQCTVDLTVESY